MMMLSFAVHVSKVLLLSIDLVGLIRWFIRLIEQYKIEVNGVVKRIKLSS